MDGHLGPEFRAEKDCCLAIQTASVDRKEASGERSGGDRGYGVSIRRIESVASGYEYPIAVVGRRDCARVRGVCCYGNVLEEGAWLFLELGK